MRLLSSCLVLILLAACNDAATPSKAINWEFEESGTLTATNFSIETSDKTFVGADPMDFGSDPGSNDRTLELEWNEHDVQMRLYIYLSSNGAQWTCDSIRTYDGAPDTDGTRWAYYDCSDITAAVGSPWTGDIDKVSTSADNGGSSRLVITGATLSVF